MILPLLKATLWNNVLLFIKYVQLLATTFGIIFKFTVMVYGHVTYRQTHQSFPLLIHYALCSSGVQDRTLHENVRKPSQHDIANYNVTKTPVSMLATFIRVNLTVGGVCMSLGSQLASFRPIK